MATPIKRRPWVADWRESVAQSVGHLTTTEPAAWQSIGVTPAPARPGKRAFDIAAGLVLVLVTLPALLVLLLASAVSYRSWPLFTHERLGRGGKPFRFAKIRSLPVCTDGYADKYSLREVRISGVGRFLRRTHLDELPQLWQVVTGQLSLVGPRPEMPGLASRFDPEFVAARLAVRPGVTGLWQVSEGVKGLIGESPEYDLWYLERMSPRFDLWILWRTVRKVLPGGGHVTLADVPWCVVPATPAQLEPVGIES
jgi:lipopolysaccharide/colanic/teichoic acid biosynthesis glycosyltransferase